MERDLNPPEDVIVGTCDECGYEIYKDEWVYRFDGKTIHEDCGWKWFHRNYDKYLEVAE